MAPLPIVHIDAAPCSRQPHRHRALAPPPTPTSPSAAGAAAATCVSPLKLLRSRCRLPCRLPKAPNPPNTSASGEWWATAGNKGEATGCRMASA
ncbi:hypothetical protein DAI22_05g089601 [Oryza sativa Japonica Group]|nr:hypothetical protein DAI22_05g089601 [Oryza sativa Japonica Group]